MSARQFAVIDIETTGLAPPAEIIELGKYEVTYQEGCARLGAAGNTMFSAPGGIPPEVMAVHHITPEMVADFPPCTPEALRVWQQPCSGLVAHNAEFEGLWFTQDVRRGLPLICTYKAALRIWPEAPGHSNQVLRYWLGLDVDRHMAEPVHRATPDAYVTAHLFMRLLDHVSADQMIAWTAEPRLLPRCPIGKFRGKAWAEVEGGFLNWMVNQPSMESDLKWNARRELDRRREAA